MTNFEFAQNLEESVKTSFNEDALSCNGTYIDNLFDKYLIIEPRPDENSFVALNVRTPYPEEYKAICIRISNIQFHQYEAIAMAIETALDFKMPEKTTDLIGLAIKSLLKLFVLTSIELSSHECVLLYYLHTHNAYNIAISEDYIFHDIVNGQLSLTENEYKIAVSKLLKIKSISIVDTQIKLEEKIILKY